MAFSEFSNKDRMVCPYCAGIDLAKAGKRSSTQIFRCKACLRRFSQRTNRSGKRSDPRFMLKTLTLICHGYTYDDAIHYLRKRHRFVVSKGTISKWVREFAPPYMAIRHLNNGHRQIVRSFLFTHRGLNYNYQVHLPKLTFCHHERLSHFLEQVPNRIDNAVFESASRCSQLMLCENPGLYHTTNSPLNRITRAALRLAASNRQRHQVVEDFLLNCDRNTLAVEVPVWFHSPALGTIAGHVDILLINRKLVYILDYKPNATKENPSKVITQLMLYAKALHELTQVPWDAMRCGYFDEEDYYSFAPDPGLLDTEPGREGDMRERGVGTPPPIPHRAPTGGNLPSGNSKRTMLHSRDGLPSAR